MITKPTKEGKCTSQSLLDLKARSCETGPSHIIYNLIYRYLSSVERFSTHQQNVSEEYA